MISDYRKSLGALLATGIVFISGCNTANRVAIPASRRPMREPLRKKPTSTASPWRRTTRRCTSKP